MNAPLSTPDVLVVDDVSKTYRRGTSEVAALRHVSLRVSRGECVAVVGESGSGKTTLAGVSVGMIRASSGRVTAAGHDVSGKTLTRTRRRALAESVQLVFQDPHSSLNPAMTVRDSVAEPMRALGCSRRDARSRVTELLDQVGLASAHAERKPSELSGGQRQRVGIARALGPRPQLLVLDEPVASLDVSIQGQILALLRDIRAEMGISLVLIAHDLGVVRAIADRTYVMYLGAVMETGPTELVFNEPLHPYSAALLDSATSEGRLGMSDTVKSKLYSEVRPTAADFCGCVFTTRCSRAVDTCSAGAAHVQHGRHEAWCNEPLEGTAR